MTTNGPSPVTSAPPGPPPPPPPPPSSDPYASEFFAAEGGRPIYAGEPAEMYHTPAAAAGGPGDVVTRASTDVAYVPYTHYKVANGGGAPTPGGPPHLNSPDSGIGDPTVTTSKIRASLKCSPAPIIACVPASCVDPDGVVVAPPPPGPPPAGGPPPSFDHYPHTDLPINICAGGGNGGGGTGSTGQSASKLFFTLAFAAAQRRSNQLDEEEEPV